MPFYLFLFATFKKFLITMSTVDIKVGISGN